MEIITGKQESMTHEANHVNLAQQTHYMRERILLEQSLMKEPNDTVSIMNLMEESKML